MTGLVRAELTKALTQPAVWGALALAVLAGGVVGRLHVDALTLTPVYPYVAVAVLAAGNEFRGGQLRAGLLAVPRRDRFLAAKLLALAVVLPAAAVVALLPRGLGWRLLVVHLLFGVTGAGFALVARSVVVPITTLAVLPVLISPTLGGVLPRLVRLLPHEAASAFLHRPAGSGLLVLGAWAAALMLAGWLTIRWRDA